MIWFRRLLTLPLILFFILIFVAALLVFHLLGTLGNPKFYSEQLRRADFYNFMYEKMLPAVIKEDQQRKEGRPISDKHILFFVKKILPTSWVQEQAEEAMDKIGTYYLGVSYKFIYQIPIKDRLLKAAEVIKSDFPRDDTPVYNDMVSLTAEILSKNSLFSSMDKIAIQNAIKKVIPKNWATDQVKMAINSFAPYLLGDSDHFRIYISLQDRVDALFEVLRDLNVQGQLNFHDLVRRKITSSMGDGLQEVTLPYNTTLTREEIISSLRHAVTQRCFDALLKAFESYLKHEGDSQTVGVDMKAVKLQIIEAFATLADQKLKGLFAKLKICTPQEFDRALQNLPPNRIPDCRPEGISYEQFKAKLHINLTETINQAVGNHIPEVIPLQQLLSGNRELLMVLDNIRRWRSKGSVVTDEDLTQQLSVQEKESWERMRSIIKNGYTFTDGDLRKLITQNKPENEWQWNELTTFRQVMAAIRNWSWFLWLVSFATLLVIGMLGGKTWRSKTIYAMVVLLMVSLFVLAVNSVTYSNIVQPAINKIKEIEPNEVDLKLSKSLVKAKTIEICHNAYGDFSSRIRNTALFMILVAAIGMAAGIGASSREDSK
jgi:hypothetical protein